MEASIATTKASCHARTNSLPSRSHPLIVTVEDQLQRLRAASISLEATTSSTSILCQNLAGLKDLFDCVDNMLQLPLARKALCNEQQDHKCVEDILDGSLRLLDMCGNTRDVFSYAKGCAQELDSSLRRRDVREFSLANEIDKYMISRKKVNRMVRKCSSNLKKDSLQIISDDQELVVVAIVDILREVETVSFTVLNSLLSFVSPYKARSKSNTGWFLVSKFIQSKRVSCEEQENEEDIILDSLEKLNCALYDLVRNKKGIDTTQLQKAQKGLLALESTMQEIEEGLERVFRCLIKTRVSLLNILNH